MTNCSDMGVLTVGTDSPPAVWTTIRLQLLRVEQGWTREHGGHLGMESKSGENLQCKDKGEGGGLRILLVKIAIRK